ncbi:hypothetical protein GGR57DRAFT_235533 [Xylariaceae sp. FL1272]|nr:hypothetical protein GGR57DRAFT_235533 [Xylariaceae sp. FL1272]
MVQYHAGALEIYGDNPEAISAMILTILEIWVAIDKITIEHITLLRDYDHHIPSNLTQNLLLPHKSKMVRLRTIERYLENRTSEAIYSSGYTFHRFGHRNSFAIRFFDNSEELRGLRRTIEDNATRTRQASIDKLLQMKDQYQTWMQRHDECECECDLTGKTHTTGYGDRRVLDKVCGKCKYGRRAGQMIINMPEWPLPRDDDDAKAVVFELNAPGVFGHWRDCMIFVLTDVLCMHYVAFAKYKPRSYVSLLKESEFYLR